ncbi:hypothetical protein BH10BAC5_BH10BAC5_23760 [soil metagenome]
MNKDEKAFKGFNLFGFGLAAVIAVLVVAGFFVK